MGKVFEYECDVNNCDSTAKSSDEYLLPKGWREVRVSEGTGKKDAPLNDVDTVTICPKHEVVYTRQKKKQ